jgi:hypothetical protein
VLVGVYHPVGYNSHCPLRVNPLGFDLVFDLANQLFVLEHKEMGIKYIRVLIAEFSSEPNLDLLQLRAGVLECFAQTPYLSAHLARGYAEIIKLVAPPLIEPECMTGGYSRRCREAVNHDRA